MLLPLLLESNPDIPLFETKYCLMEEVDVAPVNESMATFVLDETGFHYTTSSDSALSQAIYTTMDPVTLTNQHGLAKEFAALVNEWDRDTFAVSSLTKIYAHPAYQRIIAMGRDGLPYVLRELQEKGGRWFYALKFMAGQEGSDVAAVAAQSDYETARAAWLEWGYKHNYL
jgi:hypothetical protein